MIEQTVDVPTKDGATRTFIVHPERGGPFPIVLFYMDAPAIREELRDMARRIAAVGYPAYSIWGTADRCFQHAAGTKSLRCVGKYFRAAIAANSDYSNHDRKVACALFLLYLVNFRHTLRSDYSDEMEQLVLDIARCRNCVRDFLSQ